jgi:undecaprenyl-phosphate galactose phosphotransferase
MEVSQRLHLVPHRAVTPPDSFYVRHGKRWFDLTAGSLLLIAFAMPMVLVSLAIRLTSPGPALFVQERVGLRMTTFRCFKFRTMVRDAEGILLQNPQLQDAMAVSWKIQQDPRVTQLGQALRKTSMDELPQLFNVLSGKMSLVGPRPYMPKELYQEFGDHAFGITAVRPGMTGLWQTSGRSNLAPADRLALDGQYIATCDFRKDLVLLLRTVKVVLARNGAY